MPDQVNNAGTGFSEVNIYFAVDGACDDGAFCVNNTGRGEFFSFFLLDVCMYGVQCS
jgi:hypothetical protein